MEFFYDYQEVDNAIEALFEAQLRMTAKEAAALRDYFIERRDVLASQRDYGDGFCPLWLNARERKNRGRINGVRLDWMYTVNGAYREYLKLGALERQLRAKSPDWMINDILIVEAYAAMLRGRANFYSRMLNTFKRGRSTEAVGAMRNRFRVRDRNGGMPIVLQIREQ